jgi:hypothetical protein
MENIMLVPATTHKEAKTAITYIPTTGVMIWSVPRGRMPGGSKVGTVLKGERWVRLSGKLMHASDVAYFWMTGTWKRTTVANGIKDDLRWENIVVIPDKRLEVVTDEPYTYIRYSNGSWSISGNMGITIDMMLGMLKVPE